MEVTTRFKGLDLIECLKNYRQRLMTLYRRQGSRPPPPQTNKQNKTKTNQQTQTNKKTIPKKKKCKKAKRLSEEALQIAEERREAKSKGERERYTQLNAEFQRTARRNNK